MRHTVITMMSEAGIDAASAQGISGHSDLTTLQNVYTHSRMSGKRKAIDAVAELFAASSLPGRESGSISGIREKQQTA
jgi:integrase